MNDPFVSIITPYYETGNLFTETILSVEKLNYDNFEWIIIDDCSVKYRASDFLSKASKECLKHVRLIQLEENVGPNRARLRGIHQARGEFITFLDSDDIYYPNKLSVQIKFMQEKQISMSHTDTVKFQKNQFSNPFISANTISWKKYLFTRKFPVNTVAVDRKYFLQKLVDSKKIETKYERSFPGEDMLIFEMLLWKTDNSYRTPQILSAYRNETSRSSNFFRNFIGIVYFQYLIICSGRRYSLLPLILVTIFAAGLSRWKTRTQ